MKHYASLLIFLALTLSAAWASVESYRAAQHRVVAELNHALECTVRGNSWLSPDTLATVQQLHAAMRSPMVVRVDSEALRRNISLEGLRQRTFMQLHLSADAAEMPREEAGMLQSDSMVWRVNDGISLALRAEAQCSMATLFMLSDQRLPLLLEVVALGALAFFLLSDKRRKQEVISHGGLSYTVSDDRFYDLQGEEVHFTPMQHQLMRLFFRSNSFLLSKEEICEALWPKKEDASETLYTLVKRLKPVIERYSRLHIEAQRGKSYQLTDRNID